LTKRRTQLHLRDLERDRDLRDRPRDLERERRRRDLSRLLERRRRCLERERERLRERFFPAAQRYNTFMCVLHSSFYYSCFSMTLHLILNLLPKLLISDFELRGLFSSLHRFLELLHPQESFHHREVL